MKIYCKNCGKEISKEVNFCTSCGGTVDKNIYTENQAIMRVKQKRFARLSIIFGITGIYPLLFIGSIIGMILAAKGLKIELVDYKKQLRIGFWISLVSLILWMLAFLIAFLIPLVSALIEIFSYL